MLITEDSFKQLVHNTDSFKKWLLSHWVIYLTDFLAITDKLRNEKTDSLYDWIIKSFIWIMWDNE